MKNNIKLPFLLTILALVLLLISCPASPPSIQDSDSSLYQKPATPVNVQATNGYDGMIRLTWDPVEDVDGYIIMGCRSSEFDKGLSQLDIVSGADTGIYTYDSASRNVDVNQTYIFSVSSYKIYNKTERVRSDNSEFTEGSFAPSELAFHSIINDYYVYLYWMSPTLFRQYATGEGSVLYDADFSLSYGMSSEPVSSWTTLTELDNNSGTTPWLSQRIETNKLKQDNEYSFHVTMEIKDTEGNVISSITSEDVSFKVVSNMGTSPVDDLKASTTELDGIHLSWTIPEWTKGATRANSYFNIERSRNGSGSWELLVDESTNLMHSPLIEETADGLSFVDTDVVAGDSYVYRVKNTAVDEKNNKYTHVESMFIPSNAGSLYSINIVSAAGEWTPDPGNPNAADVSMTWEWDTELKEGLSWKLTRIETRVDDKTESEVPLDSAVMSGNRLTINFRESIDEDDLSYRRYSYTLSLMSGGRLFGEYGNVSFPAGSRLSLGNTLDAVNTEGLDKIILSWNKDGIIEGFSYSYRWKAADGSWSVVPISDAASGSAEFSRPDGNEAEFYFQLMAGDVPVSAVLEHWFLTPVWNVEATKGSVEDRITVSWEKNPGADGYEIFYSPSAAGPFESTGVEEYGNLTSSTFRHESGYFNVRAYSIGSDGEKIYTELGKTSESTGSNAFGETLAANYGYAFNSEPSVELSTDDGTYFRDNFIFRIKADQSHYSYRVSIGTDVIEFSTEDILKGSYDAGKAAVAYSNGNIEISTDDFMGTLSNGLTLNEVITVSAASSDNKLSAAVRFDDDIRRGLSDTEVINQVNSILYKGLHAANDFFTNNDWWGSVGVGDSETYEGNKITVENCSGTSGFIIYRPANNGSAKLDGYESLPYAGKLFTNNYAIELTVAEDKGGFLGRDDLLSLVSGSITLELSEIDSKYKPYSVRYANVYVDHSQGTYYVSVDGRESEGINAGSVAVKPY